MSPFFVRGTVALLAALPVSPVAGAAGVNVYANPNGFDVPPLEVGDVAPPLVATSWVNGDPVKAFEKGTVYLVEFWATWCQPCQKSLPHMNALQRAYGHRKLRVVGVAAAEEGGLAGLESFLERSPPTFPVALVDEQSVFDGWMKAGRASGLPWVFVVDRGGRVAWWGQPFDPAFDDVVRRAVAGTFSLSAEAGRRAKRADQDRRGWALKSEVWAAHRRGDRAATLAGLEELIALDPVRFWAEVNLKAGMLLENEQDRQRGIAFARLAIERLLRDNPHALVMLARTIRGLRDRSASDLALAEQAARRASKLTRGVDQDVQTTLASIQSLRTTGR
jgi:thiol-disulfide isomerase/thioredoxin